MNGAPSLRLSFIVEWANTEYNGSPRAKVLFEIIGQQWQAILRRDYPESHTPEARLFLDQLDASPEVLIVSGAALSAADQEQIRNWVPGCFKPVIHVAEGLEYYALKNRGADIANGELLLFVDSDVHPTRDWLAHLLGSFSNPEIHAVSGQPFVAPTSVFAAAFSLGWTYELPDETGRLFPCRKFYANNIAFRTELFRTARFPDLDRRTRGAGTLLGKKLEGLGHAVWQNRRALVDHPPPANLRHMIVRALAHGRDIYMKESEERTVRGLVRSQSTAARRLARGYSQTFHSRRRVGLHIWNVPLVLTIISAYYGFFALGGVLTHISPSVMGRLFRL
jgi:hypothetical protein